MPKYRKKPLIIEAEQWFPGKYIKGVSYDPGQTDPATIDTLEGRMIVSSGDWIIQGIEGERYPCKNSIFEKTYDRVWTKEELQNNPIIKESRECYIREDQ